MLKSFITLILDWLLGKVLAYFQRRAERKKAVEEKGKAIEEAQKELDQAMTEEEIYAAQEKIAKLRGSR